MHFFSRLVLVFAIVLVSGEIIARTLFMSPSPLVYDPKIGFRYAPGIGMFWGVEGFASNRYNSLGLNNDEIGPRLGEWRLLAIGDSYTEARQVPRAENFETLVGRLDPRIEVINGGRDGLNAASYPDAARPLVPLLSPDAILLVLSQSSLENLARDDFELDPEGHVRDVHYRIEAQEGWRRYASRVFDHSALMTTLAWRYREVFLQLGRAIAPSAASPMRSQAELQGSHPGQPEALDEAMLIILRKLKANHPVIAVYIPHLIYKSDYVAMQAPRSAAIEQELQAIADKAGIPFIRAEPQFFETYRELKQPLYGFANLNVLDGHLNERGHLALARALATGLPPVLTRLVAEAGRP